MAFATVHGSPGARVRFLGLAIAYWPFLFALVIFGWLLHAALPVKMPAWVALAMIVSLGLFSMSALDFASKRFHRFLKGARGEEIVARELSLLPEGWTVLHGVPRGGFEAMSGGSDFDHVVVGPGALFVIETMNWEGAIRVEAGTVTVDGRPVSHSPVAQARQEAIVMAKMLRDLLPEDLPLFGMVCFASNGMVDADRADVDSTPLCNVRALLSVMQSLPSKPVEPAVRSRIVSALLERM